MSRKLWAICALLCATLPLAAQNGATNGEWRAYAGEPGSTKYSPLDQINKDNAKSLRIAWRFRTDNLGPRPDFNMQSVPLVVGGTMYLQAGTRRTVVALNPINGEMLWMWRMDEEARRRSTAPGLGTRPRVLERRQGDERIVTITPGYQMVALNARTGIPVASFGRNGVVDLKTELDQPGIDLDTADIGINSPPVIGHNVVVVGAAHLSGGAPRAKENIKGTFADMTCARQAPVDLPHHSPTGRIRQRHVGERLVGLYRQRWQLGADHDRRRAQSRVSVHRRRDGRLLRRPPPGR